MLEKADRYKKQIFDGFLPRLRFSRFSLFRIFQADLLRNRVPLCHRALSNSACLTVLSLFSSGQASKDGNMSLSSWCD
jgi:hypothetical protein